MRGIGLLIVIGMGITACKTEKSPDQPTIIGVPPNTAYLGVEYYYNFGAYGGDGILDYSLTNAPSWLGLEDTANKARQGVIIRGVPGVTGGNRGIADLGANDDVNLTTTDGSRLGVQPFDIEVKTNKLTLSAQTVTEGQASADVEGAGEGEICDMPDMNGTGRHQITYDSFDEDGNTTGSANTATLDTYPIIVKVMLDQPSVQTSRVAFELHTNFDPEKCESESSGTGQACEFSRQNREEAQLGKDVVLAGNRNNADAGKRLPQPDYIDVINETSGVITLQRGITECFIRLEVVDDKFAELPESFEVALTEVRQGLVSLGSDGSSVEEEVTIRDNSPTVSFQSLKGHHVSAMNEGETQLFEAVLDRGDVSLNEPYRARIYNDPDSGTANAEDFEFLVPDSSDPAVYTVGNDLVFDPGTTSVNFKVRAIDDSGSPPASEDPAGDGPDNSDEFVAISVDSVYQYGRPGYVGQGNDLKLWLNELTDPLLVGDAQSGMTPSDVVVGDNGRIFVASTIDNVGTYDVRIDIYNRFGEPSQTWSVPTNSSVLPATRLAFTESTIGTGAEQRSRRTLGLAFRTNGAVAGASSAGGLDSAVYLYRRESGESLYTEVWHGQYGTAGDDQVIDIGLNNTENLFVAGTTTGTWPGENRNGHVDAYVQRIDSVTDKGVESPSLAWTSQQGSSSDDSVVALGASGVTAHLVGTTTGQIGDETLAGGQDLFLTSYSGSSENPPTIVQGGTQEDENLHDAFVSSSLAWTLGDGLFDYSREINKDAYTAFLKAAGPGNSSRGYLLAYSLEGGFDSAITLNDPDDSSSDTFTALTPFDGDIVVGGQADGAFVKAQTAGGILLSRISREKEIIEEKNEDDPDEPIEHTFYKLRELQRTQYPSLGKTGRIEALRAYENAEITALVSWEDKGKRVYEILLFDGDGHWLNQ